MRFRGGCSRFFVVECVVDWACVKKWCWSPGEEWGLGLCRKKMVQEPRDWVYVRTDDAGAQAKSGDWVYVRKDCAGAQLKCEDWAKRGRNCCRDPTIVCGLGPGRKKASQVPKTGVCGGPVHQEMLHRPKGKGLMSQ